MQMLIFTFKQKVIQKIGLCIGFYDLLNSSDGLIGHGTGLVCVNGESLLSPGYIIFLCVVRVILTYSQLNSVYWSFDRSRARSSLERSPARLNLA